MSLVSDLRDEAYLRVFLKKSLSGFTYNNTFELEKTWMPFESLEDLAAKGTGGKVYIIGMQPGDLINRSRTNMGIRDYSVQIGFQVVPINVKDTNEIDGYINFLQELEDIAQKEINLLPMSFNRLEYLRDPEGMSLSYIGLRKAQTFEAYFTAFYNYVKPGFTS